MSKTGVTNVEPSEDNSISMDMAAQFPIAEGGTDGLTI